MNDFTLFLIGVFWGSLVSYLIWAPMTNQKRAFIEGLTLKFIFDWFRKK